MQEKLVKNSFWSYAAKLAATILFFATDIIIARHLEVEQYAEWAFFFSILSMMYYFCWFGVNNSAKVFVSKTIRRPDERRLCIRAAIRVRATVTALLMLAAALLICLAPVFPFYRELTVKYPHFSKLMLFAVGIVGLNSFAELYKETETGTQNYRGVFLLTVLEYGTLLAAGTAGAGLFSSPEAVGLGFLAAYFITFAAGMFLLRKWNGIGTLRIRSQECEQYAKKIFHYAVPLALIGIGSIILVEMDTMMLGVLSTAENVADYAIAKQICTKASHINNALAMGTLTSFSVITAADYPQKRDSFKRLAWINTALTFAAGCAMFFLANTVIRILYGEQYHHAGEIVRFLVPYYILYGISAFYALFLDFHGKAGKRSIWYLIMVVMNFVLNILLIPGYATKGACLATVLSLIPYTIYVVFTAYRSVWKEMSNLYAENRM